MIKYRFSFPFGIHGGNGYEDYVTVIADSEDEAKDLIIKAYPKLNKDRIGPSETYNIEKGISHVSYNYP